MVRRSVLFSPGDQPDKLRTAADSGADVVVFDLEDGVAGARKARAREQVATALSELDPDPELWVRVNPVGRGAEADLAAVLGNAPSLDGVVLPKADEAGDVRALVGLLTDRGADLPVMALVESAAGVLHAEAIAGVPETDALVFGAEDLAADVGATRTAEGTELGYARQQVVLAAAAAGVDAIDTLVTEVSETDRLAADAAAGVAMGYDGKLAIHPAQVPVIHEAYTPGTERIEWARRVLDARAEAGDGAGVFEVDGQMIDAPLLAQARQVIERAEAAGQGGNS